MPGRGRGTQQGTRSPNAPRHRQPPAQGSCLPASGGGRGQQPHRSGGWEVLPWRGGAVYSGAAEGQLESAGGLASLSRILQLARPGTFLPPGLCFLPATPPLAWGRSVLRCSLPEAWPGARRVRGSSSRGEGGRSFVGFRSGRAD